NNAYTQASIFSWTKDELDIYEYWRMEETSDRYKIQEGYEKGIEKGKVEERLKNARKMKQLGVAVEIIMQVTGLNREEMDSE
ncbi:MAG: hypothetical protein WC091_23745, partial [Sulfuricellaceae bacterium]